MSPEEREIEQLGAEVSAHYRAGPEAEPSARVEAAILEAAHREAGRRPRRSWHAPAAVAAVLVLGVSLGLRMRDELDPLPAPAAPPVSQLSDLAKPAPPGLESTREAKRADDQARRKKADPQPRPSRERTARADRESEARIARDAVPEMEESQRFAETKAGRVPLPPAGAQGNAPAPEARAPSPALEKSRVGEPLPEDPGAQAPRGGGKDAQVAGERDRRATTLQRREEPAVEGFADARTSQDWVRAIEQLLRDGRRDEARDRFAEFRRRFPDHPVPESLRDLEPAPPPDR